MADIESNIRFGVDTSDAIASIKMLQAQISAFQKQMASSSVANAESARKLRRGLVDDLNATGQWSASIKNIKSTSDSFTNALEKNKLSMGEYFRFGASQVGGFRKLFSSEFNTIEKVARERVKDLQTQYISLGRDANGALKAISVRPLKLDMESLATQTAINAQRQQIFNQLLKQGSTNLLNFGKNTQWAGRQLMVGFTIPLSIFGTQASKTFMELEEQAIRFKRVYGELFTPPEEADEMLETLKELGKEFTKYGVAVEKTLGLAADAAAMGKTGVELLDQVTEANRLAVLGSVDQQQALETTISLTNAFGVATENLAEKIDFLNAVENQTVVSIEDLTIAIPKAGPVVQQLGGDVEDLAFFLTAMKEGGINASEGANALKSGLASLINPTGQAANMLKVFGINVKDIVAQSRGDVKKLVIDFATALDQLNPSQRAQAIEQLFGKFQFSRLSTLFQNVIQEGTQASRVLELTNATTAELAQLSSKELKRVEESTTFRFRKAIEEFQLAIAPVGEEFLKLITPIIEFATKIIEKFNSLSDGAKGFITGLVVLLGAVGPVALMTFGLLANGIANIIKGFTFVRELFMRTGKQSSILGEQFDYLTTEQLQAAAVAASLDQVHQTLIQTFTSEAGAVKNLGDVYRQAFNEQQRFDTGRAIARQAGLRLANGIVSVPGPKGAGDIVPAVLSPGEAVIPADAAKKYAPIIQGMIAGNLPGFSQGVMLGMPRSGKGTAKDREAAEQIYAMFKQSSYANVAPREYGHQLAKTSGHSFPIFGLGGVYMSPEGKKVFVKPVLDERSAVAEMRATQIARQAHGLKAPEQRIVVMRDPTDVKRERRFLALESALDATFVNNDPMAVFNEDQYFKQLVASLLRADKDLSAGNVFKDVVADVGPAGVFTRASGIRDYAEALPSMEEQAMINLLGIKGGAKRAFAESTLGLMAGLTPQQYHQRMISEIQQVLPLLKQTIAGFGLTDPTEIKVYSDMVKRLEQGLGVDWSKFHAIHSAVKPSKPKQSTVPGYNEGVVSVPGPKGKGDVTPAMLTPGEAVIPAKMAKKYAPLINAMITGSIPGYEDGLERPTQARLRGEFGVRGETQVDASHLTSAVPAKALSTLKNALQLLGDEVEDATVQVVEYTVKQNTNGEETREATARLMRLSEVVEKFGDGYGMVTGGYTFAGSAVLEPSVRNRKGYAAMGKVMTDEEKQLYGEIGAPETLQDVVFHGDLAAKALKQLEGTLTGEVQAVLENIVREGQNATEALASSASEQEELDFIIKQRKKAFENKIASDTGLETQEARNAKRAELDAKIASIEEAYHRERSQGVSQEQALAKAKARLVVLANEEARLEKEQIQTMHVGETGKVSTNVLREGLRKTSRKPLTFTNEAIPHIVGKSTPDAAATMVIDELGLGAMVQSSNIPQVVREAVTVILNRMTDGIVDTIRDFAEISSPSRREERVGKDLVDGLEQGILSGKDDAQQAGQIIGESISDAALGTVGAGGSVRVGRRRVTTNPAAIAAFEESQQQQSVAVRKPRRATRMGDKEARELQEAQQRQTQATEISASAIRENARVVEGSTNKLANMNSILMSGTFAISSLTGVLSLFGGQFAELNQQIFGITTALFALMQVTQLLTQAKLLELIKTKAGVANIAMRAARAADPAKVGMIATKTFGGSLLRAGLAVTKFLGPIGIATTLVVGLGSAIYALIQANEEEKAKIKGMGDAAFVAGEKLKRIGELYGFAPRSGTIGSAFVGSGTTSVKAQEKAQELSASEQFATDYAGEIEGVKAATDTQAKAILQSLSETLYASGATQDVVEAIIKAIAEKSEKTNLDLSFASINVEEDPSKLGAGLDLAVDNFAKEFENRAKEKNVTLTPGITLNEVERQGGTSFANTLKDDAAVVAGSLAGALTNINTQLANGTIDAEQFGIKLLEIEQGWNELGIAGQELILPDLAEKLNATETLEGITNTTDAFLILKAAASGLPAEEIANYAAILKEAQKDAVTGKITEDPKKLRAAQTARQKLNGLIKETSANLREVVTAEEQRAILDENYGAATAQLNDRVVALQNQSEAYQFLIDQGYDAETAFELAGDAGLAAGIKAAIGAGVGSQEWKDLKTLLDQVIDLEKKAPKGPGGSGDKSDYQQSIENLQKQRKEIINNNIAFAKLRKAGLDTATAMSVAEDPITAAALATTKVGTEKWNKLINAIKTTQALLSKKEIQDLLRGGKIEKADKQSQIVVSNALNRLGWTAEQIDEVLSDQEFTNTLAEDLKDGKVDSEALLNRLIQIKQMGKLDTELNFTTKEGAAEEFQKKYDRVVGYLEAKKQTIEIDFQIKTQQDNIIIREAENLIAAIQYKIDDYEAELTGIEEKEEVINEKYEARQKALDEISKSNESIARQQKSQLTLADALSQGDISAAARAVQEIRAQQAQDRLAKQGDLLEVSKERELGAVRSVNGKSRKQLEEAIKDLKKQIFKIEEETLEPARERIRLATVDKERQLDSLNSQILAWEKLAARVNEAKLKLTPEEMDAMKAQANIIADMLENWNKIEDKSATLTIVKKTVEESVSPEGGSGGSGGRGGSGSGSGSGSGDGDNKDTGTPDKTPAQVFAESGMSVSGFIKKSDADAAARAAAAKAAQAAADRAKSQAAFEKSGANVAAFMRKVDMQEATNAAIAAGKATQQRILNDLKVSTTPRPERSGYYVGETVNGWNWNGGSWIKKFATGGFVSGPGTATSDSIPALLSDGEYVVRASSVNKLGTDFLDFINQNGSIKGFAKGGSVNTTTLSGILKASGTAPKITPNAMDKWNHPKEEKKPAPAPKNLFENIASFVKSVVFPSAATSMAAKNQDAASVGKFLNEFAGPDKNTQLASTNKPKPAAPAINTQAMIAATKKSESKIIEEAIKNQKPTAASTKPKPAPGDPSYSAYAPKNPGEAIGKGMQLVMDNVYRGLFGQAALNAKYNEKISAGDVVDSAATVALNSLPLGGFGGAKTIKGLRSTSYGTDITAGIMIPDGTLQQWYFDAAKNVKPKNLVEQIKGLPTAWANAKNPSYFGPGNGVRGLNPFNYRQFEKFQSSVPRYAQEGVKPLLRGFEEYPRYVQDIASRLLSPGPMKNRPPSFLNSMFGTPYMFLFTTKVGLSRNKDEILKRLVTRYPNLQGTKNLIETQSMIHRTHRMSMDELLHPNNVPIEVGRTYGPGTYFARDALTSRLFFREFGKNRYKVGLNKEGKKIVKNSKGYLDLDEIPSSERYMLENMRWDNPVIQEYLNKGYLGIKHKDAYTNWLIGHNPNFSLRPTLDSIIRKTLRDLDPYKGYNSGGLAMGSDIIPSLLTPGEFVVRKYAVDNFGLDRLKAINNGTYKGDSMYNYEVNVNVQTDANADQIARAVIGQIKQIDSQRIRGNRF